MGKYRRLVFASMASFVIQNTVQSQSNFIVLEKNFNIRAKDLIHELNATNDSLILTGTEKIRYIYSINEKYLREIDTYAGKTAYKVALSDLSKGKHVMVVSHQAKLIIFVIKIFREDPAYLVSHDEVTVNRKDMALKNE